MPEEKQRWKPYILQSSTVTSAEERSEWSTQRIRTENGRDGVCRAFANRSRCQCQFVILQESGLPGKRGAPADQNTAYCVSSHALREGCGQSNAVFKLRSSSSWTTVGEELLLIVLFSYRSEKEPLKAEENFAVFALRIKYLRFLQYSILKCNGICFGKRV